MTIDVASPPASSAETGRGLTFLSKAVRTIGYARVGTGALAAGTFADQTARLLLPVERVVAADIRVRTGGTRLLVNASSGQVVRAAKAAAAACGLHAGEVAVSLRLPMRPSHGTDTDEAVVLAIIDGVAKATEAVLSRSRRATLAAELLGGRAAGLAAGTPAIGSVDGKILASTEEPARLLLVLAQHDLVGESAVTVPDEESFGTLIAPGEETSTEQGLAAWLVSCSGGADHPAADAMRAVASGFDSALGVVGGHTLTSPVAILLPAAALTDAQQIRHRLTGKLPEHWRASISRSSVG